MTQLNINVEALPKSLCRSAEASWPSEDWPFWHRYTGATADKFGSKDRSRIPPACQRVLDVAAAKLEPFLDDGEFVDFDLHAAGMHMIPPGGFVAPHCDAEVHPLMKWQRTRSAIIFVNSEWSPQLGGALELHSDPKHVITPTPATMVVFPTDGVVHSVSQTTAVAPHRRTLCLFVWKQISDREWLSRPKSSTFVKL